MSFWNALMSFLGIGTGAAKNMPPSVDATSSVEPQPKTEEALIVKPKGKLIEAEYPFVLKPDATLLPAYHQVGRGDKGVLEDFFFDYLVREFPDSANNAVAIIADGYNLTPDLAIIDAQKKLFIALEIDEPYTVDSGGNLIPIHVKGSDTKRDDTFIKYGWTVIRFAEEQIAKCPQLCVEAIRHFVNTGQLLDMNRVKRWTLEEAKEMVKNAYRDNYLPFAFKGVRIVPANSDVCYRSFEIANIRQWDKNGKRYIQINLKYPHTTDDACNAVAMSNHPKECWVDRDIFWEKVSRSKLGELVDSYNLDASGALFNHNTKSSPVMLECYGKQDGRFFNISGSKDRFNIVFSSKFLENTKNEHLAIVNKIRIKHGLPRLT